MSLCFFNNVDHLSTHDKVVVFMDENRKKIFRRFRFQNNPSVFLILSISFNCCETVNNGNNDITIPWSGVGTIHQYKITIADSQPIINLGLIHRKTVGNENV